MRSRLRSPSGADGRAEGRPLELVRVRGAQRRSRDESGNVRRRSRRRGGRGRGGSRPPAPPRRSFSLWRWLLRLFRAAPAARAPRTPSLSDQEERALAAFQQHYRLTFTRTDLLKLALTHRSYLSVTGQGPRDSNERLEFLGDSVLGLVTSEFLYRENPTEHEGQLTKIKSLLVSKAILSRRALAMGLGRFVLMSHSEVESGGRQRLSILADAFESVVGAIYLDQGFEAARAFIHRWLLRDSGEIVADKRHTNYKSHLQEYVQSTFHTHPVYRIRGEAGPDHSKHFQVEVTVGKRVLGEGRGRNKKEAEQAAARDAIERLEGGEERRRAPRARRESAPAAGAPAAPEAPAAPSAPAAEGGEFSRRGRRGGRRLRAAGVSEAPAPAARPERSEEPLAIAPPSLSRLALPEDAAGPRKPPVEIEPPPPPHLEDVIDELGRPEGPLEERHVDPYGVEPGESAAEDWAPPRASAAGPAEGAAAHAWGGEDREPDLPEGTAAPAFEIEMRPESAVEESESAAPGREVEAGGERAGSAWGRRGRKRRPR